MELDIGKDIPAEKVIHSDRSLSFDLDLSPQLLAERFLSSHRDSLIEYISNHIQLQNRIGQSDNAKLFRVGDKSYLQISMYSAESALGNQALKSDTFPGIHRLPYPNFVGGCSNFRQVKNSRIMVYGVSQPTVLGIKNVLKYVNGCKMDWVFWINLREEPVIYVNEKPFCCRERETLDINLDYLLGIQAGNLQEFEERLRSDLVSLVKEHENTFEYYYQGNTMVNELYCEPALPGSIKTVKQLFEEELIIHGEKLSYRRVPVTDECAPDQDDFNQFVELLREGGLGAAYIFNCQMGRGRTTTGMVCAYMFQYFHALHFEMQDVIDEHEKSVQLKRDSSSFNLNATTLKYIEGNYKVVQDFFRNYYPSPHYEKAIMLKKLVDQSIDACDHIQNLRECIYECKLRAEGVIPDSRTIDFWMRRGLNYLERYLRLLIFGQYLHDQIPLRFESSYTVWLKRRWGISRLIRNMTLE